MEQNISALINKFGFPVIAVVGMGIIIVYVWNWTTKEIKPKIKEVNHTLIGLIDRIRTLDNDLIRLNEKVNVILRIREQEQQRRKQDNRVHPATHRKVIDK